MKKLIAILLFLFFVPNCFGILVARWPLQDNIATSVVENVVNNDDGVYYSESIGPTAANTDVYSRPGRHGRSLVFDGVTAMVNVDSVTTMIQSYAEGSITAWFNGVSAGLAQGKMIFSTEDDSEGTSFFSIFYHHGNTGITVKVSEGGAAVFEGYTGPTYMDDDWHLFVFTNDSGGNNLYIDGVLETLTYVTGSAATDVFFNDVTNLDKANIGARWDTGLSELEWFGSLQDVRIYDHALTQAEISALYDIDSEVLVSYAWFSDIHWLDGQADVVATDRYYAQVRTAGLKLDKALPWAIDQNVDFIVFGGDSIETTDNEIADDGSLDNLINHVNDSTGNTPVYFIEGNHDTDDEGTDPCGLSKDEYLAVVNAEWSVNPSVTPFYYSWDTGGVHFIALDSYFTIAGANEGASNSGPFHFPAAERNWLATELATYRNVPVVVFSHVPVDESVDTIDSDWGQSNDNSEDDYITVLNILETYGNVVLMHSGHYHPRIADEGSPPRTRSALYLTNSFRLYDVQGHVNGDDSGTPGTKAAFAIIHIYKDNTIRIEPYADGDASGTWGHPTFGFTPPVGVNIRAINGSTQAAANLKNSMDKH